MRAIRGALLALLAVIVAACTTLPPGARDPKTQSAALAPSQPTHLGEQVAKAASEHGGNSGFRIITAGVDGFSTRMQMIDSAERTLDLQYFIFRGDETGRLLTDALLRAAHRGVRIRVLVDDGDVDPGDEQLVALDGKFAAEVRIFNPFAYRGHSKFRRSLEFLFHAHRLDYRMHNKLLVVDNAVALVGGRNIGNQYFQMDPASQYADDDVFAAGPIVKQLSATFDEYWNSELSIPVRALTRPKGASAATVDSRVGPRTPTRQPAVAAKTHVVDYMSRSASGEPYAGMLSGRLPLVWAPATVVCDSPDKRRVERGDRAGYLMAPAVAATANSARSEMLMVTPYFVPSDNELKILKDLRRRGARVGVLTNSLESAPTLSAHAGYTHYRVPLLKVGVDLYESRALLGNAQGSGESVRLSRYGNYALHAKLFVIDRQKVFIGSMNYDQRSRHINTEIGLIIDNDELAQQTAARFAAMVQMDNAYVLALRQRGPDEKPRLVWDTREGGKPVEYYREPARSDWQRVRVWLLSLLPLDSEL